MPVWLRDFTWRQTASAVHLILSVPGGQRLGRANVFCGEQYLKVGPGREARAAAWSKGDLPDWRGLKNPYLCGYQLEHLVGHGGIQDAGLDGTTMARTSHDSSQRSLHRQRQSTS